MDGELLNQNEAWLAEPDIDLDEVASRFWSGEDFEQGPTGFEVFNEDVIEGAVLGYLNQEYPKREGISEALDREQRFCFCCNRSGSGGTFCLLGVLVVVLIPFLSNTVVTVADAQQSAYWDYCAAVGWEGSMDIPPELCYDDCVAFNPGRELVPLETYAVQNSTVVGVTYSLLLVAVEFFVLLGVRGTMVANNIALSLLVRGVVTTPSKRCCGVAGWAAFSWRNFRTVCIALIICITSAFVTTKFTEDVGVGLIDESPFLQTTACNSSVSYVNISKSTLQFACGLPLPGDMTIVQVAFCFDAENPTAPIAPTTWSNFIYRWIFLLVPIWPIVATVRSLALVPNNVLSATVLSKSSVQQDLRGKSAWYTIDVDERDELLDHMEKVSIKNAPRWIRFLISFCGSRDWSYASYMTTFLAIYQGLNKQI